MVFAEMVCANPLQPDAIGWRSGRHSMLVECKVSRGDFRADRKKWNHCEDTGPGQERRYLTPPGLVRVEEVPERWGLIEAHKRSIRVLKTPAEPHWLPVPVPWQERWHGDRTLILSAERSANELSYLYSAMRRVEAGVPWIRRHARFETIAEKTTRTESTHNPGNVPLGISCPCPCPKCSPGRM